MNTAETNAREMLTIEAAYHQEMARAKFHAPDFANGWFTNEEDTATSKREAAYHYAKARECLFQLIDA
jgi:hypothetical protein